MEAGRDGDWYGMKIRGLSGLVNDILAGLTKASSMLPGGGPALAEDILRVIAGMSAERSLAESGAPKGTTDPFEALQRYIQAHVRAGVIEGDAVRIEESPGGRVRFTWRARQCMYKPHCDRLTREGLDCVCPRRLFAEQVAARATGRQMGSIALSILDGDLCVFELFPVSAEMLRPMQRLQRNASMIARGFKQAKSQLTQMEAQHRLILETTADAILVIDSDRATTYINPRACGVFALCPEEALGRRLERDSVFGSVGDLCVEAARRLGKWEGDTTIENREGDKVHNIYHLRFTPMLADGGAIGTLMAMEDITQEELLRRELEAQAARLETLVAEKTSALREANAKLEILARTDSLTALANRRMFEEILHKELKRSSRTGQPVGILVADIDDFKIINDRFGHQQGDEILVRTARLLAKSVRESDTVARWGGDEFIILLPNAEDRQCRAVVERIEENVLIENAAPDAPDNPDVRLSVGWASDTSGDATALIAHADDMMYEQKARRKAKVGQRKY